jgi:hypothetical protein
MTPAEAQAEVNAIMANPKDPYWDKNSISHRQQIERVQELYGMIHG